MKTLKNSILCFVLLCGAAVLMAQAPEWQWAVGAGGAGGFYGQSIAIDSQDNKYVIGYFEVTATFGNHTLTARENELEYSYNDVCVAKLDPAGNWLWAVQTGGPYWDQGRKIALDDAGNAYVTGCFKGTATFGSHTLTENGAEYEGGDVFIAKLDTEGNWLWAVKAGEAGSDEMVNDIVLDSMGNIYVTGMFTATATFGSHTLTACADEDIVDNLSDIFVAKLDVDGNWLWAVNAGGPLGDEGHSIALDNDGNAYVTGSFQSTATFGDHTVATNGGEWNTDIFIAKLDSAGKWLWAVQAGGELGDEGCDIAVDNAGNAYVTGGFGGMSIFGSHTLRASGYKGYEDYNEYFSDIFVAKLDTSGNWLWTVQAGGSHNDGASSIALDDAGNAYITGIFGGTATFGNHTLKTSGSDVFVAKLDPNGTWLWVVKAGGSDSDQTGCDIALDDVGNTYVTGRFGGTVTFGSHILKASGEIDLFVAKLGTGTPVDDETEP